MTRYDPCSLYAIDLYPYLPEKHIKMGSSWAPERRVREHQWAIPAPEAELLRTWPIDRSWEVIVLSHVASAGFRLQRPLREVFATASVSALLECIDAFITTNPVKEPLPGSIREVVERLGCVEGWRSIYGRRGLTVAMERRCRQTAAVTPILRDLFSSGLTTPAKLHEQGAGGGIGHLADIASGKITMARDYTLRGIAETLREHWPEYGRRLDGIIDPE